MELKLPMLKSPPASSTIRLVAFALIVLTALSGVEASQSTSANQSGAVQRPVAVSRVAPVYPDDAIKARVEGIVILEATVSETGRVTDAKVLRGPSPSLMESARIAVLQWRYEPARLNGAAVSTTVTVSINFNLPRNVIDTTQEQRERGLPVGPTATTGGYCVAIADGNQVPVADARVVLRTDAGTQSDVISSRSGMACGVGIPTGQYQVTITKGDSRIDARILIKAGVSSGFEAGGAGQFYFVWVRDTAPNGKVMARASLFDCTLRGGQFDCSNEDTSLPLSPGRSAPTQKAGPGANFGGNAATTGSAANTGSTAAGNMGNAGSTRGSTSANTAASSGPSSAKLPPLRLEDTNWFCTIKLSEGREFDGFVQFRSDNTVKLVETVRRNWPDTDYGPGGTSKPIMWPVLYPGYNGEEQIAHLRNPNTPGNAGDRWASTTDEARFFTTTVGQVYRLNAKGGQLFGTIHSPEERSAERYYRNFTSTPVFDVGFLNPPFGSIACAPARAWMQR